MTTSTLDMLTLTITCLPIHSSEESISRRLTSVLPGSEVRSIQLTKAGRSVEAFVHVQSPLSVADVTNLLGEAKLHVRRRSLLENKNVVNTIKSDEKHRQRRKPKKPIRKSGEEVEDSTFISELASCFHLHVNAHEDLLERATDREEMGIIFQEFLSDISSADRSESERRKLEGLVMASLRRQRLLRSKRFGDRVIMTMARMGGPGDFPSQATVVTERDRVLLKLTEDERNKEGVAISNLPLDDLEVGLDESKTLTFHISSDIASTMLERIQIGGSSRAKSSFSVVNLPKMPFILGEASCVVDLVFYARSTRVYRCQVRFSFKSEDGKAFDIVRCVKIRCGDVCIDETINAPNHVLTSKSPRDNNALSPLEEHDKALK